MFEDVHDYAYEKGVNDIMPVLTLDPGDITLAHLATSYATEHYYSPDYIRTKI